ncbi:CU044_5270 family protein [Streptomyces sp. CSDS2]|uniref:CU044_5270 family protein n=1 Tax=Streptomyces sp. CSDS2 TaxID=3055051 RepID=UPI0025AEEEF3|nr:CU044_5270 family protein [Streptomyces sp. CSDS2]MDN3262793.1 CU044_5270 family protein [Streptomyces sp. CSDS2]
MSANTSRPLPGESEEAARLLSRTARDLPTGRHEHHKERLMARIEQEQRMRENSPSPAKARRLRLPRPVVALPALAAAVAAAVIAGTAMTGGNGDGPGRLATGPALTTQIGAASPDGVSRLLDQVSLVAAEDDHHPVLKAGQYVYISSKAADTFVKTVDDKSSLASHALHQRQVWYSADGTKGWLIDPTVNDSPEGETLSLPDEQGNTPVAGLNHPSYDYLTKLPTDPDTLLAKIYKETRGHGNSPDQEAFTTIGDLLGESYPPPALSKALFKAAAKIPGVVTVNDAVDAVGRHGVAVARLDETSGQREEWIFDRNTHIFLGQRSVQVSGAGGPQNLIKPGTVLFTSAVLRRAIVDDIKQVPAHTS